MASGDMRRDRMAVHLSGLSPDARSMILKRMEQVGTDLLAQSSVRGIGDAGPTPFDAVECFFRPFAPFTIDEQLAPRQTFWLARRSQTAIWSYLGNELMPEAIRPWSAPTPDVGSGLDACETEVGSLRRRALAALKAKLHETEGDDRLRMRFVSRLGGDEVLADLIDMIRLVDLLPALERTRTRLPASILGEPSEKLAADQLRPILDANPESVVPIAVLIADRLSTPGALVRIAARHVKSLEVVDLRRSPMAGFVDVALSAADRSRVRLADLVTERRDPAAVTVTIGALFETLRAATVVVRLDEDKIWRQRLSTIRANASDLIGSRIDGLLPTLRRAFKPDAHAVPHPADVEDAVSGVAIFTATRRHREMTALNESVARIGTQADQAIDLYARQFLEALRAARGERRAGFAAAAPALVQVSELLHGADHAQILRRAVDVALKQSAG